MTHCVILYVLLGTSITWGESMSVRKGVNPSDKPLNPDLGHYYPGLKTIPPIKRN